MNEWDLCPLFVAKQSGKNTWKWVQWTSPRWDTSAATTEITATRTTLQNSFMVHFLDSGRTKRHFSRTAAPGKRIWPDRCIQRDYSPTWIRLAFIEVIPTTTICDGHSRHSHVLIFHGVWRENMNTSFDCLYCSCGCGIWCYCSDKLSRGVMMIRGDSLKLWREERLDLINDLNKFIA